MGSKCFKLWIYSNLCFIIVGIIVVGVVIIVYFVIEKLIGGIVICLVVGCDKVFESFYVSVFGLFLVLFGFLVYIGMGIMAIVFWFINLYL